MWKGQSHAESSVSPHEAINGNTDIQGQNWNVSSFVWGAEYCKCTKNDSSQTQYFVMGHGPREERESLWGGRMVFQWTDKSVADTEYLFCFTFGKIEKIDIKMCFISSKWSCVQCSKLIFRSVWFWVFRFSYVHQTEDKNLQDPTANWLHCSDIYCTVMHVKSHPTWCLRGIKQSIKAALGPRLVLFVLWCALWIPWLVLGLVSQRREEAALHLIFFFGRKKKHLYLQPTSARGEPEPHCPHYVAEYMCVCGECPARFKLSYCWCLHAGLNNNS